ncbi:MAG: acetyl-CoA C-acyltransferase [Hyphomicrobiales bacterium]|nr:acetyl-CoA C-acyltransferase [Hyphomicrobiales bacterium]
MNRTVQDAYIVAATRTPVARRKGAFARVRPDDMLAHVLRHVVAAVPGLDAGEIGDVVVGCAMPEAEQGMNVARIGALLAGLPDRVPAITINRFCASGLNAVAIAADRIRLGECDVAIGAGTESMTVMAQMMGNKLAANPAWFADEHRAIAFGMGITAEKVAARWRVGREDQDAFAVESHRRALAAIEAGRFRAEITPYPVREHLPDAASGEVRVRERLVEDDEGPRPGTTMEALAKLKPVFAANGTVTAGNASQMSDGAAAVLLMSEAALARYGVRPLARFVSFAVVGVPPEIMGIGPVEAIPRACALGGVRSEDIGWIELNEAFAAQSLAVIRELNLDPAKVNPLGGAIALGHPLGATGAIRTATLVHAFRRDPKLRYGMVTMCIGTGMGAAGLFERT